MTPTKNLKALCCLPLLTALPATAQPDQAGITTMLTQHYAFAGRLGKLSVSYRGERQTTYQSDDFRQPYTIHSRYEYQYDTSERQFYFHDQHVYPGNFIFNKKMVHRQGKTTLYDVNGFTMGKQLEVLDYSLDEFRAELAEDIDFLAAHRFLSNGSQTTTSVDPNGRWVEITKTDTLDGRVTARFALAPVRLSAITYHDTNRQTTFSQPVEIDGLRYAGTVQHFRHNKLKQKIVISDLRQLPKIDPALLAVPEGYGPLVEAPPQPLQWQQLAKDLYLISFVAGDRHVMVKADATGLTAFGAPVSPEVSRDVVALINKHLPGQRIHSVYITHPHSDHLRGLAYYANMGITIVADAYSLEAIKAYPAFAGDVTGWRFQAISHRQRLNGATYYVPDNSHSLGQSFVLFDDAQILYQGDFLEIPADNSLPTHMADVEKEFIDFLRQEKISYRRIVGHHRNNNITPDIVDAYYAAHHPEQASGLPLAVSTGTSSRAAHRQ